jgi:hypothetical protein
VLDSEVIFTCRLTSTVSAPAVLLLHHYGLAAHLCKDFTRGYCPRHSLLFNYHDILQFGLAKVKGCKAIRRVVTAAAYDYHIAYAIYYCDLVIIYIFGCFCVIIVVLEIHTL